MQIRTVEEVVEDAGGPEHIMARAQELRLSEKPLHLSTIYKWRVNGIPEKLWSLFISDAGATAQELHLINEDLRNEKRKA